jgi:hypothetical protein
MYISGIGTKSTGNLADNRVAIYDAYVLVHFIFPLATSRFSVWGCLEAIGIKVSLLLSKVLIFKFLLTASDCVAFYPVS